MSKRGFLIILVVLTIFSSLSLAYTGDITNGIIPADTAYHELIHIANGTDMAGNILSIDANKDGTIDTAERSIEGVRGSGIPNALMKFRTNKNVTNSTIYELNGNVGFHIRNPTDTLQIMTGHIWNLGQNDAGIILRSGDEISNGINIVTSSNGDLRIQTRYDKKNYDSLFIKGDTRNIGIGITNPLRALDIRSDDGIHLEPSKLPNSPLAGDIAIDNKDKKLKWYDGKEWLTVSDSKSLDADDGNPADVVYVDSIGNVGIGTTSPSTQLDINGNTQINGQLIMQSDINMGGNIITNLGTPKDANDAATVEYVDTKIAGSLPPAVNGQTLRHDGSDWVAASNLFNNGANVGIGTTTPSARLDITPSAGQVALEVGRVGGKPNIELTSDYGIIESNAANGLWLNYWSSKDVVLARGGGRVGIGTSGLPTEDLEVIGNIKASGRMTASSFIYSSDRTLKINILSIDNPLEKVQKLNGVSFKWKNNNQSSIGFIAQDVERIFPEIVHTDSNGLKSLEYGNLVAVLVEAIKEQQKEIEELEIKIENLKKY